jgi:thiol-disulfide isomerase/thioredoxin
MEAGLAGLAADRARDFYTNYPGHPKAGLARQKQFEMLQVAVRLGNTNRIAELEKVTGERLKDPSLPEDQRFQLRQQAIERAVVAKRAEGDDAMRAEYERGLHELQKDFPKRDEVYDMLLTLAQESSDSKARELAREVIAGTTDERLKEAANGLLKRLDMIGKPLELAFTSIDGREVDLKALAGKVVLVDFWATWCVPCVGEMPSVKAAYNDLHAKGFEIVGISLDSEKAALEKFVAKERLAWPQFFDGQGWGNKFARAFGINSIPAMWLVDKKGNLRDINARDDLEGKVQKLLAE